MITCKVSERKKHDLVAEFYSEETNKFFKKIHKKAGDKWECVADTCASIDDGSVIYEVYENNKLAAFFVHYKDDKGNVGLEGFHVKLPYRNKKFLTLFSDLIKMKLGINFFTGIYEKNKPALGFLQKMGMSKVSETVFKDKLFYILKY